MKSLQRVCGAVAVAIAIMATTSAAAEPQRGSSVHLTAATAGSQGAVAHKTIGTTKTVAPRKKKSCF